MLVSVVIPTYNRAPLLRETLRSLESQSYDQWECIVVDDGSTDETKAVVEQFDSFATYIRQENQGPAAARNRGMERAQGDAVLFLDSDDVLLPQALEKLVGALRDRPSCQIAYGGYYVMHADGRPGVLPEAPQLSGSRSEAAHWSHEGVTAYGLDSEGNILPRLLQHDAVLMGATLFRREVLEATAGFDPTRTFMEHWEYVLRIADSGFSFVPTGAPVVKIRMHEGNLSGNFEEMLRERLSLIDRYLPDDHPDRERIREAARTNARFVFGVCLLDTGQIDQGLSHLRDALVHRSFTDIFSYQTFTRRVCEIAMVADDPPHALESMLDQLGSSLNARAVKHFAKSRFYRRLASRRLQEINDASGRSVSVRIVFGGYGTRSMWHLGVAMAIRPSLGRWYLRRVRDWIRQYRPIHLLWS